MQAKPVSGSKQTCLVRQLQFTSSPYFSPYRRFQPIARMHFTNSFLPKLMCLAVAWIASAGMNVRASEQPAQSAPPTATVQWRRTVHGWERADLWQVGNLSPAMSTNREVAATAPLPPPQVHPILVAGFLLTAAGLMAIGAKTSAIAPRK